MIIQTELPFQPIALPRGVETLPSLKQPGKRHCQANGSADQPQLPFEGEVCRADRAPEPVAVLAGASSAKSAPALILELPDNLEEVLFRLKSYPAPDRKVADMKGALRGLGKVLRRPLRDIPTRLDLLRPLLAAATPASAGMTTARWSRIRSKTLHALALLGFDVVPGRDIAGLSAAWTEARDQLPKREKIGLSGFMSYCTRAGIEPGAVEAATFEYYRAALGSRSLRRKPKANFRATVRLWNKAIESVHALPQTIIPLETDPHFYSRPWDEFPPSFTTDVEAFLTNSGSQDEFSDHYVLPVKPSTVVSRRRQLREMASMLVASGFGIEKLTSLTVLVEPANVRAALKQQRARIGAIGPSIGGKAWLACVVARHWVKNCVHADALRDLARQLSHKQPGMTPRNREQLRQFDLKANLDALLGLPKMVFADVAREKPGTAAGARRIIGALAVEFLLVAPMRVGNLVGMEHERHLLTLGRGRDRNRHILIPGQETKTGKPFEMLLPPETARLLEIYLDTYRHGICPGPSPFLFPNKDGESRSTIAFSRLIQLFVFRETGLRVHAHLFRQLAGKLHLDLHPNDIETVRLLFGHTNSSTTRRYYTEQKTDQAYARYDGTITRLRSEADRLPTRHGRYSSPKTTGPVR